MEVKFGITDISREVSIETTATPDQIADQVRQAVVDAYLGAHHDKDLGDDDAINTGFMRTIATEITDELEEETR